MSFKICRHCGKAFKPNPTGRQRKYCFNSQCISDEKIRVNQIQLQINRNWKKHNKYNMKSGVLIKTYERKKEDEKMSKKMVLPEFKLWAKVLKRAEKDLKLTPEIRAFRGNESSKTLLYWKEHAKRWFSSDAEELNSFIGICRVLGYDPQTRINNLSEYL